MAPTNIFSGLKNAKTSERGSYTNPGVYTVRINKVISKRTRKNFDAVIVEFTIVKSNYVAAKKAAVEAFAGQPFDVEALEKTLPNKEGTTASWFQSLADQDIGWGALKGFAASLLGEDPANPEFVESVEMFLSGAVQDGDLNGMLVPLK